MKETTTTIVTTEVTRTSPKKKTIVGADISCPDAGHISWSTMPLVGPAKAKESHEYQFRKQNPKMQQAIQQ